MSEVILTVGPRASGKSEFCRKALQIDPTITMVSRDELLLELFGSTSLSSYTGDHYYASEQMWEMVKDSLRMNPESRMIMDTWNGSSQERVDMIFRLRNLGANKVRAWYFVTPLEYVDRWFWQKPGIAKMSEMGTHQGQGIAFYGEGAPGRDYKLFHQLAKRIHSDGFDEVVKINPLTTQPEQVLGC